MQNISVPGEVTVKGGGGRENWPQYETKSNLTPQSENFQLSHNSKCTRPEMRLLQEGKTGSCNQKQTGLSVGDVKHEKTNSHMIQSLLKSESFQQLSALDSAFPDVLCQSE